MNRDPILIRVDADPQTGYEHLARCQTLAAALQRRRRPTYFLSRLEPGSLGLAVKRGGNEWLRADEPVGTNLDATICEGRRLRPAAVLVDGPEVSESYLAGLGRTGVIVACYFVTTGLAARDAINRVRRLRPGSIETSEQAAAVTEFARRQHEQPGES